MHIHKSGEAPWLLNWSNGTAGTIIRQQKFNLSAKAGVCKCVWCWQGRCWSYLADFNHMTPNLNNVRTYIRQLSFLLVMSVFVSFTLRGWKSYFTQCWKPFPFDFSDVTMRQFPTKWAEYPTPLLVRKLPMDDQKNKRSAHTSTVLELMHII